MRLPLFLVLTIVGVVLIVAEDLYTDIYDKMDVDVIINSERVLKQYLNCLLDRGPCTADGRSLRRVLPDALQTNCARCNDRQKEIARKLVNHIKTYKADIWEELKLKYDPNGIYIKEFSDFLSSN